MICVIALVVFGILGIFSARYRAIAKEALDCVFRRVTFRKCTSGLDERLKSQITGRLMRRTPRIAGFVYRRFEIISWLLLALMIWSMVVSGISGYNFIRYGNCNGPGSTGFCIFDPFAESQVSTCSAVTHNATLINPGPGNDTALGPADAPVTLVEFGCYSCPYTKKAEAVVRQVIQAYPQIRFVYRDFPIAQHGNSSVEAEAARCSGDQGKYWEYHRLLFDEQNATNSNATIYRIAGQLQLNISQFSQCLDSNKYLVQVNDDFQAGVNAGVYGTPTFFIGNTSLVGPQAFAAFKAVINKELKKAGGRA